ncbi:MAG: 50S ribosomal protein L23 [Gammaproteobacteria bacterium RIFCSPHIGHO2_12_FULL_41_15]|nr:MAG: 50S ribosomal protein L23 [Gammaproteobacteria bacterium RIFCSPHIGHO2_12_FULL_41_15]
MKTADLIKILLSPRVTEKTTLGGSNEKPLFAFNVHPAAHKKEIAAAVEYAFNVKVATVRTANFKGKTARFGKTFGRHKNWKKAYVRLEKGHNIEMVASEG